MSDTKEERVLVEMVTGETVRDDLGDVVEVYHPDADCCRWFVPKEAVHPRDSVLIPKFAKGAKVIDRRYPFMAPTPIKRTLVFYELAATEGGPNGVLEEFVSPAPAKSPLDEAREAIHNTIDWEDDGQPDVTVKAAHLRVLLAELERLKR